MIKVLLADDEYLIREGMRTTIPWADYNMEVVATAENGEDGLELARAHRPDLVITDICMPFCDGLEMSEGILQERPETVIIILTCFDEFDYARKALQLGAFDYVLKPIDLDEFGQMLSKLQEKWARAGKISGDVGTALAAVLHGRGDLEELQERLRREDIPSGQFYGCVMCKLLGFDYAQSVFSPQELQLHLNTFAESIRTCAKGEELLLERHDEEGRCWVVVGKGSEEALTETTERICRDILSNQQLRNEYPLLCGVSEPTRGEAELAAIYRQCKEVIRMSFLYDDTRLIRYRELSRNQKETADISSSIEAFTECVRTFDNRVIQEKLQEILENIRRGGQDSILYGQVFIATAFTGIIKTVQEVEPDVEDFMKSFVKEYQKIIRLESLSKQVEKLGELTEKICALIGEKKCNPHAGIIQKARQYIEANYANSTLSLQGVSQEVHMSPSYFSIIFKRTVGKSFINFLTDLRMEKAKHLLRHTPQKAYEVCYLVGYDNPTYFSTLFKRTCGMGPSEYRQQWDQG